MTQRTKDTKARILEATRTLFSAHGAEGTTIDDIITAAGVTKGAFYHYFKSKELLCQAVLEHLKQDYQQLAESVQNEREPIMKLRKMISKLADLNASGEWVNCRLILRLTSESHTDSAIIQQAVRDFWEWYSGFYEDLITQCRQSGQLNTSPDVKTQLRIILSLMAGACLTEKVCKDDVNLGDMADAVLKMLQKN